VPSKDSTLDFSRHSHPSLDYNHVISGRTTLNIDE